MNQNHQRQQNTGTIVLFSILAVLCFLISVGIREYWKLKLCSSASVYMLLLMIALFLVFAGLAVLFLYQIYVKFRKITWIKWVGLFYLISQGIGIMISVLEMVLVFRK